MLMGIPIGFSIGLSSFLSLLFWNKIPLSIIVQRTFSGIDTFPLMAVPLFILAGELMSSGKIMDSILEFVSMLIGHIRGGLAYVVILASMFFGGITGSAVAETSALGSVEIPLLKKSGYEVPFSAALVSASAIAGPIIPPSIPMVLYAMAVPGTSVGALFVGGIIPGILLGLMLMIPSYIIAKKRNYPKAAYSFNFPHFFQTFKRSIWALIMPLIIMGGILSGAFTPTEAAAMAVLYALVIGFFITKDLKLVDIPKVLLKSGSIAGMILIIVAFANIFSWILTTQQVPMKTANFILSITHDPYMFIFIINVILLIVGCFVETAAAILIMAPVFAPIAFQMGIDPLHFGIIFVLNLCIGIITPPLGLSLFVSSGIAGIKLEEISKAILPFLFTEICVLFLVSYIPSISLLLVNWLVR